VTNWYCTLDALKAELQIPDSRDDARLTSVIESVSRAIDDYCRRHFFVLMATKYFTADCSERVLVDDLLSITSLKTDSAGNLGYATTWSTSDYVLAPRNALQQSPPAPYWQVRVHPTGSYCFPACWEDGVQIVGKWGRYQVLSNLTTLSAALDASATTTTVPTGYAKVGQTWLVDSEQLFVSAVAIGGSTDTVTLDRGLSADPGLNGTTRAAHLSDAAVQVYSYPVVDRACLIQSQRIHKRGLAPLGVLDMPATGTAVWVGQMDPEVRGMLDRFLDRQAA
jgi:hypothetical protein